MGTIIYDAKTDPAWEHPYLDVEEDRERELPDGSRVFFHYVHGGFREKGVKFSFCFPAKERFQGRFFQYLSPFPGPDEEMASFALTGEDDRISFALTHGAYFVESNMGSLSPFGPGPDPALLWKSSAAVAEYSRVKAMEYYGCKRPYGYVHGGSGGGYKTMACIENTNAWDGAVPFVIGSPYSLPNTITLHVQGQRTLRHAFGKIVDALDAGGSGDMYEGLTADEAAMLKEITAMGFPPRAWFIEANGLVDPGSLPVLTPGVKAKDPAFFREFWTVPGYAGADPESNAVRDRLQFRTRVVEVHLPGAEETAEKDGLNDVDGAWKKQLTDGAGAWIAVEELPVGEDLYLEGVNIGFADGEAAGRELLLKDMVREPGKKGGCLTIGMCYGAEDLEGVLSSVKPGDQLTLDNSDYIAIQHYYRHQVPPDASFHAWDQFRGADGAPALPQRAEVMGPGFCGTGTVQDGNIQCKTIVIQAMMDESTCPWCGDWYRNRVRETKGGEQDFRIYYMDRCLHGNVSNLKSNMVVNYLGALNQALLDMSDWVERGVEPPASTVYEMKDNQVYAAETAEARKGIQPLVELAANGGACARVKAGDTVTFTARASVPQGAGEVTALDFDFTAYDLCSQEVKHREVFTTKGEVVRTGEQGQRGATAAVTHVYREPGVYFASVLVKAQRQGDVSAPFTQVQNLARARVIVEA